jgi:hypothetical protein
MMSGKRRFLMQFAISAVVALATPAVAAGLVAGTSVAMQSSNMAIGNAIYPTQDDASAPVPQAYSQATHGPARLSVLAGNDQAAWDNAHSVHVNFSRPKH